MRSWPVLDVCGMDVMLKCVHALDLGSAKIFSGLRSESLLLLWTISFLPPHPLGKWLARSSHAIAMEVGCRDLLMQ
jgi:hypothetical protein